MENSNIQTIVENVANSFELDCEACDDNMYDIMFHHYRTWYGDYAMVDTLVFNKKGYHKFEKLIDKMYIKYNGYTIYCTCDVSGYDYWTKNMIESNYIMVTIKFDEGAKIDLNQFEKDLDDFIVKLDESYSHLLNCKSYRSKTYA